jgi:hypothetical protein
VLVNSVRTITIQTFFENILGYAIKEFQYNNIKRFLQILNNPEETHRFYQILMGSGKSKTIIPMVVLGLLFGWDGKNNSVIMDEIYKKRVLLIVPDTLKAQTLATYQTIFAYFMKSERFKTNYFDVMSDTELKFKFLEKGELENAYYIYDECDSIFDSNKEANSPVS